MLQNGKEKLYDTFISSPKYFIQCILIKFTLFFQLLPDPTPHSYESNFKFSSFKNEEIAFCSIHVFTTVPERRACCRV